MKLKKIIKDIEKTHTSGELALGFIRYETLRKLNPRQFAELHKRNLAGEFFDGMVDQLAEENK